MMKRCLGFSLIEVLVTMLIMAIGMLGAAALQLQSKRVGYDATQRAVASNLAQDIVERMRTNNAAVASYQIADLGGGSLAQPGATCSTSTSPCSSGQMALLDLWEFEQALDGASASRTDSSGRTTIDGLSNPTACITHAAGVVTVSIAWRGAVATSNPDRSNCGIGQGKYGDNDENRQLFTLTTYVGA